MLEIKCTGRRVPFMDSVSRPKERITQKIRQKRQINTNDPNQNAKRNRVEPTHPRSEHLRAEEM